MRRIALAITAVLVILVASAIMATRTIAMSIAAPAGLTPAINETLPTEQVYWRRHWRRHYWRGWGWPWRRWGWRRHSFWGFPLFAPHWYGYPHHRHHRHRVHKAPQQKQEDQPPKPEDQPSKPRQQEQEPPQPK
jgi:hypothetical protein